MKKRVIITGASDPLGVVLIQECIKREIEILAVVQPDSAKRKDIPDNQLIKIVEMDICDIEQLESFGLEQFDICFHLAWTHTGDEGRDDPFLQTENIQSTLKTAKCAKSLGCKVFVGAGSQAEYGRANRKVDELSETHPDTWYGCTKFAAGQLVMEYCRQNGMRCNWVRIFGVYGPYENEYVLSAYVTQMLLAGNEPVLTPCGQIWDYVYCEDVAHALVQIGEAAPESGVYCLGSGSAKPLKEYVTMIRDAIDPNLPLGIGRKPYGEYQIMHLEANISKLRRDIGDVITTPFEAGIKKTIAWYRGKHESSATSPFLGGRKPLALFGLGLCCQKFYYNHSSENIMICFDEEHYGETFHGLAVVQPDVELLKKYYIVVTQDDYQLIKDKLIAWGLEEFEDFTWWKYYGRQLAVIHGNCYINVIKRFLEGSEEFNQKYFIYDSLPIHLSAGKKLDDGVLAHCDLLMIQDIQWDNPYGYQMSLDYISMQVPKTCKRIVFPNLVWLGSGFFPQFKGELNDNKYGLLTYHEVDENIKKLYGKCNLEEIIEYLSGDVYEEEYIVENFQKSLERIRQREGNWDIKILDFIMQNYKERKVFFDTRHPAKFVFEEIVRRILRHLGMKTDFVSCNVLLNVEEMPVYPCVKKALGLLWNDDHIREGASWSLTEQPGGLREYVQEYCYWVYDS